MFSKIPHPLHPREYQPMSFLDKNLKKGMRRQRRNMTDKERKRKDPGKI
jgi:hypothetical protein